MKLVWGRAAVGDLEAISDYVRADSPRAARTVVRRIRAAALRLTLFPLSGSAGFEPGTRELVVTRTPYVIVYRVVERARPPFAEVIGVFHGARDRISGVRRGTFRVAFDKEGSSLRHLPAALAIAPARAHP